jgi:hypothetical protein
LREGEENMKKFLEIFSIALVAGTAIISPSFAANTYEDLGPDSALVQKAGGMQGYEPLRYPEDDKRLYSEPRFNVMDGLNTLARFGSNFVDDVFFFTQQFGEAHIDREI